MAQTINVRVHLPETAEGLEALREAMARFNGAVLIGALNKLPAPIGEKRAYLEGLQGAAPWANNSKEDGHGEEGKAAG